TLLAADRGNLDVKLHLALALDDQAMTLRKLGLLEDAAPPEREAVRHFSELVETDPDDVDNRLRLYQTEYHLGCLEMDRLQIPAANRQLGRALDGLTALDREGKLEGRPRDRQQLRPWFEAEKSACIALSAMSPQADAIRSTPVPRLYRLLRIQFGLLLAQGRAVELRAAAKSLGEMNASNPEYLYELGRSLAWCAGEIDRAGGPFIFP